MWRYILNRILWLILVAICVGILIFTIMYFVPDDPARMILGSEATAEEIAAYREYLGLNRPFVVQLADFLQSAFLHLDFGVSYFFNVPVAEELFARLPRTLMLGWFGIIFHALVGIPLGITCALNRNKPIDHILMIGAMIGVSIPDFWLALLLVMLFSLKLGWLPPYGIGSFKHWIMPLIAVSVSGIAVNARQSRSAVLETVRADFVTTARAKGLQENKVIYKHMLPNALIPIIANMGTGFAASIAGSVVIETVFSFPGVGTYLLKGISSRDYPIVRGCVLILALFAAVIVLIVDIVYAYVDPRIKAQYVNSGARKGGKK